MNIGKLKRSGSSQSAVSSSSSKTSGRAMLIDKADNPAELVPYKITINSSPKRRAGVSCWLRIYGYTGLDSGRILLEYGSDGVGNAIVGSGENFSVDAPDIGKPKEIELTIDGDLMEDNCIVKDVVIYEPIKGKSYVFRVDEPLVHRNGNSSCEKKTYPVHSVITTKPKIPYEIYVITGDVIGSGDVTSNVTMKLFGSDGSTEDFILEKFDGRFHRAAVDKIKTELCDVGELRKLRISVEAGSEWFLEKVEFLNLNANKCVCFPCSKWFSETQSDGLLSRDLSAVTEKGKPILKTTAYTISVKTSDIRAAGTDANVFCMLFGENGDSGELALKTSLTHRDKFERGNIDQFLFADMLSLGQLQKLRIWHDNSGLGASWHLDSVTVYDDKADSTYVFPCKQWLSAREGEMLCRELVCDSINRNTTSEVVGYEVSIVTGDKSESETYNHVWLTLHGDEGVSDRVWFQNSSKRTLMRRSQMDTMYLPCPFLGLLRSVTIGHFPRETTIMTEKYGKADQWFCKEVMVKEPSGKKYFFPCNKWITLSEDQKDALKLKQEGCDLNGAVTTANPSIVQYEIAVFTGDQIGAGTDANVYCVLYGEKGDTGRRHLTQRFRNLFERAQRDAFVIENQFLGKLTRIYVEHDSSGFGPSWLLDRMEIKNLSTGEITTFPCGQWISKSVHDGLAALDLLPAGIRQS